VSGKKVSNILRVINTRNNNEVASESDDFGLYDKDNRVSSNYFLNYYSPDLLKKLLKECGIVDMLSNRHKFKKLYVKIDINQYDQHSLIIYDESTGDVPIVLLRLREVYFDAVKDFVSDIKLVNIPMLMIDWITLQNPTQSFTDERKKMPGQEYPGLGMLRQFYKFMLKIAKDLAIEALLAVPEYFHLASIYSPIMNFYDPELQGKFESMLKDLHLKEKETGRRRSIVECSKLIEEGKLFNYIKNEREYWHPSEMISILNSKSVTYRYFKSPIYIELKNSYKESNRYRFLL
jgi:hypothetical protein